MRSWTAPAAGPAWSPACHELRHTCLTRLRLAGEYRRAAPLTGADAGAVAEMLAVQEAAVR
jgi:hypothetical protein